MEVIMPIMTPVLPWSCLVFKVNLNSERRVGAFVPISLIKELITPSIPSFGFSDSTDGDLVEHREATSPRNFLPKTFSMALLAA
jgi:hypothetical protein